MSRPGPLAWVAIVLAFVALLVAGAVALGGDDARDVVAPRSATTTPSAAAMSAAATSTSIAVTASTPGTVTAGPATTTATTAVGAPPDATLKLDLRGLGPMRVG